MTDVLKQAIENRVREDARPVHTAILKLREALCFYEDAFLNELRESATAAMLHAVGSHLEKTTSSVRERQDLLQALDEFRALVAGTQVVTENEPLDVSSIPLLACPDLLDCAPDFQPELLASQQAEPSTVRKPIEVSAKTEAEVSRALEDFERLFETYTQEHPSRLRLTLRVSVADIRRLLKVLPLSHAKYQDLSEAIRKAGHIKDQVPDIGFVRGLARNHNDDWAHVSAKLRARLQKFDADVKRADFADKGPASSKPRSSKTRSVARTPMFNWPALPRLRQALKSGPAIVVGGSFTDDKKDATVHQRLGLVFEWFPVESDEMNAVRSLTERIRSRRVSVVVVMNGFMSHKVWHHVQDACNDGSVPYALAGRGGIGEIEMAVHDLEQKLAKSA